MNIDNKNLRNVAEGLEELAENAGEALYKAIDASGDGLNDLAAHIEDKLGDGLRAGANLIDELTETTPLKELGDKLGEGGRELAEKLEGNANKHLEDLSSTGE